MSPIPRGPAGDLADPTPGRFRISHLDDEPRARLARCRERSHPDLGGVGHDAVTPRRAATCPLARLRPRSLVRGTPLTLRDHLSSAGGVPAVFRGMPIPFHDDLNTLAKFAIELEPPIGIEPMTYALREARSRDLAALPAQIPTGDRSDCPLRTGRTGHSFQISFHVPGRDSPPSVTEGDDKAQAPRGLTRDAGERARHLPAPHAAPARTSASILWSAGTGQPCSAGRAAVVPERITERGRAQRRAHADPPISTAVGQARRRFRSRVICELPGQERPGSGLTVMPDMSELLAWMLMRDAA
jgi:hypothetical protein